MLPSIGGAPAGVVPRPDLPPVGSVGIRLVARQGLDPEVELAALESGEMFLARVAHPSARSAVVGVTDDEL